MRTIFKFSLLVLTCGLSFAYAMAQCPQRPAPGTVVHDALSLTPTNGVLKAEFTMRHSVDEGGFTHYCYIYDDGKTEVEAPTLRLHQGDQLILDVKDRIKESEEDSEMSMDMSMPGPPCADGGTPTLESTNVHFHGMNISPDCHHDDVLTTLIQPGSPGFEFNITVPKDEPPGLYWYHPHVHGFTEFQVNGGAAGAIVVEGMDKVRPEVKGLKERVFVLRQQYLVPWVPGPYDLTLNYELATFPNFPSPIIDMKPGTKEFWRVVNATIQDFMPLQVWVNNVPQKLQVIALDGYPLSKPRYQDTILVPPAGRAEFIVEAPPANTQAYFYALNYSTGPTGNPDLEQRLANIELTSNAEAEEPKPAPAPAVTPDPKEPVKLKFADLAKQKPTAQRKIYFSEEFGGTNGPIQFYVTVDGQKQKVFEANEKPVIVTNTGAVEDWTIENRALETHDFHIHQIHFLMLEVDGKPVDYEEMRDTYEIPFWEGPGYPYHSIKVRMDFRDPTIAGTFVFHCHILLHEDLGMMHKILVTPQ